jgi:hypothetical protein
MAIVYTQSKARLSLIITSVLYVLIFVISSFVYLFRGFNSVFGIGLSAYYHYPIAALLAEFIGSIGSLFLIIVSVYFYQRGNYRLVYGFGWIVFLIFSVGLWSSGTYVQSQFAKAIAEGDRSMELHLYDQNSGFPESASDFLCPSTDGSFLRIANSPDLPDIPQYPPHTIIIKLIKTYTDPVDGVKKNSIAVIGTITDKPHLDYKTGATDAEKGALDAYVNSCTNNFGKGEPFSTGYLRQAAGL